MRRGGTRALVGALLTAGVVWALPAAAQTDATTQPATPAAQSPATPVDPAAPPAPAPAEAQPAPTGDPAASPATPAPAAPTADAQSSTADLTATASSDGPSADAKKRRRRRGPERAMNTISANLAGVPFGLYGASFERALNERFSLNVDAVGVLVNRATPRGRTTVTGIALAASFRWFILGKAPVGLFLGPNLGLENLSIRETIGSARGSTGSLGGELGYAHIFWNRLYLGASAGAVATLGPVSISGPQFSGLGWRPFLRANLGVAF